MNCQAAFDGLWLLSTVVFGHIQHVIGMSTYSTGLTAYPDKLPQLLPILSMVSLIIMMNQMRLCKCDLQWSVLWRVSSPMNWAGLLTWPTYAVGQNIYILVHAHQVMLTTLGKLSWLWRQGNERTRSHSEILGMHLNNSSNPCTIMWTGSLCYSGQFTCLDTELQSRIYLLD